MGNLGNFNVPDLGKLGNNDGKPPEFPDHRWKELTAKERWEVQMEYNMEVYQINFAVGMRQLQQHADLIMAIARILKISPITLDLEGKNSDENKVYYGKMQKASVDRQKEDLKKSKKVSEIFDGDK